MDVPSWWIQVLRGPRSKSEKWRAAPGPQSGGAPMGRWRQHSDPKKPSVEHKRRIPDPDTVRDAASQRVASLESALLQALAGFDGPEVQCLQAALTKARHAARGIPLKEQVSQTEAFIAKSRKRLAALEQERAEQESLEKALQRQKRLKEEIAAEPRAPLVSSHNQFPPPAWAAEMEALRAKLATAEEELSAQNLDRDAKLRRLTSTNRPSPRLQEDFVCGGWQIAKPTFGTRPWQAMHTR